MVEVSLASRSFGLVIHHQRYTSEAPVFKNMLRCWGGDPHHWRVRFGRSGAPSRKSEFGKISLLNFIVFSG